MLLLFFIFLIVSTLILLLALDNHKQNTVVTLNPPIITNLVVDSGQYTGTQAITWTESGGAVTSRTVEFTAGSGVVDHIQLGSADLTDIEVGVSNTVRVTLINSAGSDYADINISNPCFLGHVRLVTNRGAIEAKKIQIGDLMLQPDNSFSKVLSIKKSTVKEKGIHFENDRLFADSEEKMVVTYWHKVKFSDEVEEQMAGKHEKLHEVFYDLPFDVYNYVLDNYKHKILIADTNIIAESFVPVNPA
jgi:hypothetical protein